MRPEFSLFYLNGRLRTGWVAARKKSSWRIVLADGQEIRHPPQQILYSWQGAAVPKSPPKAGKTSPGAERLRVAALARLAEGEAGLEAAGAALDLEALHRRLRTRDETAFEAVAALALPRTLPQEADGWARAALYAALLNAPRLFRRRGEGFAALDETAMERMSEKQDAAEAREAWRARVAEWSAMLERGEWEAAPEGETFLAQLESLLAHERRSPHWRELARPLGLRAGGMAEQRVRLRKWLVTAGHWPGWPKLWLMAGGVEGSFPPALEDAAIALATAPVVLKGRADFRRLPTYTIDAAGTEDLDDACSILAADEAGLTVALHIAEPAQALAAGHPLFDEAARRMSSVYTAGAVYPMLPAALSEGRFSLLAGEERETLTFTLRLEEADGVLLAVEPGVLRVTENLDYARADALLDREPATWGRLGKLCAGLMATRAAQGAALTERVGVAIDHGDPERITLERYSREGPAQRVVEELAILVNREAGRYCRKHGLPAIYRVQPAPRSGDGPWPPARFSLAGAPHAGLACDRYIQVTSPIRRFPDLLMQRQIAGHAASGQVTYAISGPLESWVADAERRLTGYAELERRIGNYWKRRYLAQHKTKRWRGTVRRATPGGRGKVWLEDLLLLADAELDLHTQVGDVLAWRVAEMDPERELLRLAPV